jgi:hypothetical protein
VVLKCDDRVPADTTKKLEQEKDRLTKEVVDKKVRMEIPKLFNELRDQAKVTLVMTHPVSEDELRQNVDRELQATDTSKGRPTAHRN